MTFLVARAGLYLIGITYLADIPTTLTYPQNTDNAMQTMNTTQTDCIRTLPRGGMYWEIHPPRPERFTKGVDFALRGPRDFPRAKPEGNLEDRT